VLAYPFGQALISSIHFDVQAESMAGYLMSTDDIYDAVSVTHCRSVVVGFKPQRSRYTPANSAVFLGKEPRGLELPDELRDLEFQPLHSELFCGLLCIAD
jgi:hypothetical protein